MQSILFTIIRWRKLPRWTYRCLGFVNVAIQNGIFPLVRMTSLILLFNTEMEYRKSFGLLSNSRNKKRELSYILTWKHRDVALSCSIIRQQIDVSKGFTNMTVPIKSEEESSTNCIESKWNIHKPFHYWWI